MNRALRTTSIVLAWLSFWGRAVGAEPNEAVAEKPQVKVAIIACKGMIDDGLYKSISRRTEIALDKGAKYVVYEINTYGGTLSAAFDISDYFLHEANAKAHTVAYVSKNAISAGAMISVACADIIMKENTKIGDCAPVQLKILPGGGNLEGVDREKIETVTRAVFVNSGEANGYPEALLKAMVTMQIEVYRVRNIKTGAYEFFESTQMPKGANEYDLDSKELIVKDNELLTLTASQAYEYGIARAKVKDLAGALEFLAERDGVTFAEEPMELKTNWSEEMVRWLNSPVVFSILFMVALLGVYMELNTPGVGLPGLVAVICFAVLFGSKYLTGLANWIEVALFIVGVLLLLIEIFVTPGFGMLGVLGILCMLAGLLGMLVGDAPKELPWSPLPTIQSEWDLFTSGALALSVAFIGFVIIALILTKHLPRIPILGRLVLATPHESTRVDGGARAHPPMPVVEVGQKGVSVSQLRPSGIARFGNTRLNVVSRGELIEANREIMVAAVEGNSIVVREIANPKSIA